ncbi:MAG: ribbon-helix-helix protein, CopG family [Proteobacteria bacterium]|nr:ribbon-helix-helix protein, CopG family [Pseudomonadota bacterium]MBS0463726.1 ribbon-helix-helix protein, CopG family [Pseudomonadota bacterium]
MTVRATFALDEQTDAHIRELAERWHVSQAEVIRRAVRKSVQAEQPAPPTPAEVVAHYRRAPLQRSIAATKRWIEDNRAARHADDRARDGRAKP